MARNAGVELLFYKPEEMKEGDTSNLQDYALETFYHRTNNKPFKRHIDILLGLNPEGTIAIQYDGKAAICHSKVEVKNAFRRIRELESERSAGVRRGDGQQVWFRGLALLPKRK